MAKFWAILLFFAHPLSLSIYLAIFICVLRIYQTLRPTRTRHSYPHTHSIHTEPPYAVPKSLLQHILPLQQQRQQVHFGAEYFLKSHLNFSLHVISRVFSWNILLLNLKAFQNNRQTIVRTLGCTFELRLQEGFYSILRCIMIQCAVSLHCCCQWKAGRRLRIIPEGEDQDDSNSSNIIHEGYYHQPPPSYIDIFPDTGPPPGIKPTSLILSYP